MAFHILNLIGILISISLQAGEASVMPGTELAHQKIPTWCQSLSHELHSVNLSRCLKRDWGVDLITAKGNPVPYMRWEAPADEVAQKTPIEAADGPRGHRVMVIGAMHGDEQSAVSIVFRWIEFLEKTKKDSFLRKNSYIFFPLANPDGFFKSPRTRVNASGIDINRNFETSNWLAQAQKYWEKKTRKDPRYYPGKAAASELETQMIQKWVEDFKPEIIVSIHAPYGLVDHDGPIIFPGQRAPLPLRTLGAFPGSLGQYAGIDRKIPVVTVELREAAQIPEIHSVEDLMVFIMKSKF